MRKCSDWSYYPYTVVQNYQNCSPSFAEAKKDSNDGTDEVNNLVRFQVIKIDNAIESTEISTIRGIDNGELF